MTIKSTTYQGNAFHLDESSCIKTLYCKIKYI